MRLPPPPPQAVVGVCWKPRAGGVADCGHTVFGGGCVQRKRKRSSPPHCAVVE